MQATEKIKPCFPLFRDDDYKGMISRKREKFEEAPAKDKVIEIFDWTTTKEYQDLNFKREALTINPAKLIGLADKGHLCAGADADITLIDPNMEWVVDRAQFASKSHNTPWHGAHLKGRAVKTIVGGRVVWDIAGER